MPLLENGERVELICNALGIINRENPGQRGPYLWVENLLNCWKLQMGNQQRSLRNKERSTTIS